MKKLYISLIVSIAVFLFFGFFARCFPLGCVLWDFLELVKILLFISLPAFIITYAILYILQKRKIHFRVLISSLIVVYFVAFLGGIFTSNNFSGTDSDWYDSVKPGMTPPDWVFPVVWNILYFLIALSIYFMWNSAKTKSQKTKIIIFFGINLLLNVLWSYLFFSLQEPVWAFYNLIALWFSVIYLEYFSWSENRKSFYFLIPYFLWISFAGILNYLIAF